MSAEKSLDAGQDRAQDAAMTTTTYPQSFEVLNALVGETVVLNQPGGHRMVGTLESVYMTDGIAANVHGLIDWAKNGKPYGRDFSMGPLYGATITPCPAPWIGYRNGHAVKVYADRAETRYDLANGHVDSVAPYKG